MEPKAKDRIAKVVGTALGGVIVLASVAWGVYKLWVFFVWW